MESEKPETTPRRGSLCGRCIPTRYGFTIFASLGMFFNYALRVNFHIAMVSMVNHTYTKSEHQEDLMGKICGYPKTDDERVEDGPLLWGNRVQGWMLSGYFIGYMFGQFPGGRGAEMFDAKWVFTISTAICIVCTLLIPICSIVHWALALFLRILTGFGAGFAFPCMHVLLAHWAPPKEVSFMATIVYAGVSLGTLFAMLTAGFIAKHISWEAVFYIHGGVAVMWLILWVFLIEESPTKQKFISDEERQYIIECTSPNHREAKKLKVPWKAIFTSMPFYALGYANFASCWGWYMLLTLLPQYMKRVLRLTITQNTTFTSIPYFTMWLFSLIFGRTLDYLRKTGKWSTTTVRKFATIVQAGGPGICLGIISIFYCQRTLGIILMTIAVTIYGSFFSGFLANHLDICPNFAGTVMSLTNTVGTIPGILVPVVCGELLHQYASYTPWLVLFMMTIGIFVVEIVTYTIWGSGEVQPWNEPKE